MTMQYAPLGRTGVLVSRLALGTMTFGGPDAPPFNLLGRLRQDDVDRLVGVALDAGVNLIDTADMYGAGESETLLGRALKGRRKDVVLATKGYFRMGPGVNQIGSSRLHLMDALHASLDRLSTDHVDLYQLHGFDPHTPLQESLRALCDMVRAGKVRYIGCSNFAAWQISKALGLAALHDLERLVSVQAYYSLAGCDIERELVPMLADAGMALLAWSPLAGGFLSGKFSRDGAADSGARRAKLNFPPLDATRAYDIVDVLTATAARHHVSVARLALAWVLAQRGVTSVTLGARTVGQLTDNLAALDLVLSADDLAGLDAASAQPQAYPGWMLAYSQQGRLPNG